MTIVGAFYGGGNKTVPAGKCLLHLSINTIDRLNLGTASWTVTATGKSFTATADSTGRADLLVDSGLMYTVTLTHQGSYYNDDPQTVAATSTGVVWVYFDLFQYPDIKTVVQVYTDAGTTVVGTSGSNSMSVVADNNGLAQFSGLATGSVWTFTANGASATVTIDRLLQSITVGKSIVFSMAFNASTFATDPRGCLTYSDDCAGFTPVGSPPSALGACQTVGSWDMNEDGSSSNPYLNKCFYATFDSAGNLHQRLNPKDLTQVISVWNATSKKWIDSSGSSAITTENTMFCFPALYRKGSANSVTIGDTAKSGVAYGATIDGHTYEYEAIGVYEGYVNGSKLMSLSGKASSANITRPTFRTYAAANTVKNGKAMVWNFHQWRDWWHLCLFAAKDFNGQRAIGQGGFPYKGSTGQGLCNKMGLWAGCTVASADASHSVKALIENPWGYKFEFIDDFVNIQGWMYAGQNSKPTDDVNNKVSMPLVTSSGWQKSAKTAGPWWGMPNNVGGSSTTYQCDYLLSANGTFLGGVGGYSDYVSLGYAGPSCLNAFASLSSSISSLGARLAFVFDL
jgi:hypothetical protein